MHKKGKLTEMYVERIWRLDKIYTKSYKIGKEKTIKRKKQCISAAK